MGASFTSASQGSQANIICGTNTGQHSEYKARPKVHKPRPLTCPFCRPRAVLLEASDMCNDLTFAWTDASPREWEINIVQYSCDDPYKRELIQKPTEFIHVGKEIHF